MWNSPLTCMLSMSLHLTMGFLRSSELTVLALEDTILVDRSRGMSVFALIDVGKTSIAHHWLPLRPLSTSPKGHQYTQWHLALPKPCTSFLTSHAGRIVFTVQAFSEAADPKLRDVIPLQHSPNPRRLQRQSHTFPVNQ